VQALDLLSKVTDNMMHKRYETKEDFYQQLCMSVFAVLINSFIAKPSLNLSSALPRSDRNHVLTSFNASGNGTATINQLVGIAPVLVSLIIDFLKTIETNTDNRSRSRQVQA
jgi:hypothetical protein